MTFKELHRGSMFSFKDNHGQIWDTIYIKTEPLYAEDYIHGNCIIISSKERFVNTHSGELTWFNDETEVVERDKI